MPLIITQLRTTRESLCAAQYVLEQRDAHRATQLGRPIRGQQQRVVLFFMVNTCRIYNIRIIVSHVNTDLTRLKGQLFSVPSHAPGCCEPQRPHKHGQSYLIVFLL